MADSGELLHLDGLTLPIYPEDTPIEIPREVMSEDTKHVGSTFLRCIEIEAPVRMSLGDVITTAEYNFHRIAAMCGGRVVSHEWCVVEQPKRKSWVPGYPNGFRVAAEVSTIDTAEQLGPDTIGFHYLNPHLKERTHAALRHPKVALAVSRYLLSPHIKPDIRDMAMRQFVQGKETASHLNDNQSYTGIIFTDIDLRLRPPWPFITGLYDSW